MFSHLYSDGGCAQLRRLILSESSCVGVLTLLLPHVWNGLSAQSICAFLCLGEWSLLELVDDSDIEGTVSKLGELDGDDKVLLEDGWDRIVIPS